MPRSAPIIGAVSLMIRLNSPSTTILSIPDAILNRIITKAPRYLSAPIELSKTIFATRKSNMIAIIASVQFHLSPMCILCSNYFIRQLDVVNNRKGSGILLLTTRSVLGGNPRSTFGSLSLCTTPPLAGKYRHLSSALKSKGFRWVLRYQEEAGEYNPGSYLPDQPSDVVNRLRCTSTLLRRWYIRRGYSGCRLRAACACRVRSPCRG